MRRLALVIALAVSACNAPAPTAPATPAQDIAQVAPLEGAVLTVEGLGPLRIGMTVEQARELFHDTLEQSEPSADNPGCSEWGSWLPSTNGVGFMAFDGVIHRITVTDQAPFATPEGIHVGSSAAETHAAYPNGEERNAEYFARPAHEYFVYTNQENYTGLFFEIGEAETVVSMEAGGSLGHPGGCF